MTKQQKILRNKRRRKLKCNADKVIQYFDTNYPNLIKRYYIKYKIENDNSAVFRCDGEVLRKISYKGLNGNVMYWSLRLSQQNRMLRLLQKYGFKLGKETYFHRSQGIDAPKFIKRIYEVEDKLIKLGILKIVVKLKRKVIHGEH